MGPPDQPHYLNAVSALDTALTPQDLLRHLLRIEREAGRVRKGPRWTARTLDLDLLLYDDEEMNSEELTVPHPGVHERAFVIHPLAEIAPRAEVPGRGRASTLAARVSTEGLERLGSLRT